MIYKLISCVCLLATAVMTYLMLTSEPQKVVVTVSADGRTVEQQGKPSDLLSGFTSGPEVEDIEIHVSYNDLTGNQSKTIYRHDGTIRYVLMGDSNGKRYRCVVSEDFWRTTEENSILKVPANQCSEISPAGAKQ